MSHRPRRSVKLSIDPVAPHHFSSNQMPMEATGSVGKIAVSVGEKAKEEEIERGRSMSTCRFVGMKTKEEMERGFTLVERILNG